MLKIIKKESILWPVKVNVPRDDGSGKSDEHTVKVRYRLLSTEEQKQMQKDRQPADEYVKDRVLGWEDIADENGPLEFSRANLDWLMDIQYLNAAFVRGFFKAQSGATEKN